jgi:peptidoglycan/LPS O-acetylase OafA/YrhL
MAYCIFFFLFFYREKTTTNNKIVKYLGTISYTIYLLHPTWILLVKEANFAPILSILLVFGLTILSSKYAYIFIEKIGIKAGKSLIN